MAGFGLDSKQAMKHNHERNEPARSGAIACRICDAVFMSDKALFDHVEIHFLTDEPTARKRLLFSHLSPHERSLLLTSYLNQRNLSPSMPTQQQAQALQQPRLPTVGNCHAPPLLPRGRNLFPIGNNSIRHLDPRSLQTRPITPYAAPQQVIFVPQPRMECFTRPLLNQLEASLLVEGMSSVVDQELAAGKEDQETLDVTLKLGREEV